MIYLVTSKLLIALWLVATSSCADITDQAESDSAKPSKQADSSTSNASSADGRKNKERDSALHGSWKSEASKTAQGATSGNTQRWDIDRESVTIEGEPATDGTRVTKYRYHLDPLRDPPELTLYNGQNLRQCIYKLDGESLTVEFARSSEGERPRGFSKPKSDDRSTTTVLELKRVKPDVITGWEERAVQALISDDRTKLQTLAAEFRGLSIDTRRGLSLSIRDDWVEFTFRGEVEGEKGGLDFMEFLIAGRDKNYEAMLITPEAELKRVAKLRPFFNKHDRAGRAVRWDARLVWAEDNKPRSAELKDILSTLASPDRDSFLDALEIDENGYFGGETTSGTNVAADRASVPQRTVAASLVLTLRRDQSQLTERTGQPTPVPKPVTCEEKSQATIAP